MTKKTASELKKRVITGLIGSTVLLTILIFGGWVGILFISVVISLGMVAEYANITLSLSDKAEKRLVLLCMAWFVHLANLLAATAKAEIAVLCFLAVFTYFLVTAVRFDGEDFAGHFKELTFVVFGAAYLIFMPLFFPLIHQSINGVNWTILFLLIVWSGDTGAYFAGKKYGKMKLYPKISPKKTVEGAVGGLAAGLVVAFIYKLLIFRALSWGSVFLVPLIIGSASQAGDLCESFVKRAFGVKDSGSILPGHGGFLDRFDGVVFSLPVMYACTRLFG
ncbi:phosphatidate cytidylyltransferase [Bdellovibrionota bacterium FG-2]